MSRFDTFFHKNFEWILCGIFIVLAVLFVAPNTAWAGGGCNAKYRFQSGTADRALRNAARIEQMIRAEEFLLYDGKDLAGGYEILEKEYYSYAEQNIRNAEVFTGFSKQTVYGELVVGIYRASKQNKKKGEFVNVGKQEFKFFAVMFRNGFQFYGLESLENADHNFGPVSGSFVWQEDENHLRHIPLGIVLDTMRAGNALCRGKY